MLPSDVLQKQLYIGLLNSCQLYRGGQFYWWMKPSTRRKLPANRKFKSE